MNPRSLVRASASIVASAFLSAACGQATPTSATESLAANAKSAHNIAMVITGTTEDGRAENLDRMQTLLSDPRLGFEVRPHYGDNLDDLLAALTQAGADAANDGTLLVYFNSHGGANGDILVGDEKERTTFSAFLDAVAAQRSAPLARLVALVDTCHSEASLGTFSLDDDSASFDPSSVDNGSSRLGRDYTQALIMTSSSLDEVSMRPAFSSALNQTFGDLEQQRGATLQDLVSGVDGNITALGYTQQPQEMTLPDDSILHESLF